VLTILPPDYLQQRADQIRRQNDRRRRHRLDRAVVGRFDSVSSSATPRERLAPTPSGLADAITRGPALLPAALPADIARIQYELDRAAGLQRAAADLQPIGHIVDFRGDGFLSD
jgi:hypothetical protein